MELFIIAVVIAFFVALIWYYNKNKTLDANKDGKTDFRDVKPVAQAVVTEVAKVADVNNDGKVNATDVVEVAKKVKKAPTKTTTRAKAPAKPKAAKKPKMTVVK